MRKKVIITLQDRGKPLTFEIREMSACRLEDWLIAATPLIFGPDAAPGQLAGLGQQASLPTSLLGLLRGLDYDQARPLLDELLTCCTLIVAAEPPKRQAVTPANVDRIIEDVGTLMRLRTAALHVNLLFCQRRRPAQLPVLPGSDAQVRTLPYPNLHPVCGTLVSSRLASLRELESFYSYADALNMLDVLQVDNHNEQLRSQARRQARR